jgi:hypothetical protein
VCSISPSRATHRRVRPCRDERWGVSFEKGIECLAVVVGSAGSSRPPDEPLELGIAPAAAAESEEARLNGIDPDPLRRQLLGTALGRLDLEGAENRVGPRHLVR